MTDVYLRQRWHDPRLSHNNLTEALDLADPNLVKAIWKPEVFFPNAKEANFQFVTVPNVLIRIHPDGEILFILRYVNCSKYHSSSTFYHIRTMYFVGYVYNFMSA